VSQAVYSYQLLSVQDSTADVVFTNDDDHVVIIRDLDCYMGATVGLSTLYLRGSSGNVITAFTSSPAEAASFSWRGRQVIPPGASFSVTFAPALGAAYDCAVSGYRLTLP
jgi:hypothetical protein